MVGSAIQPCPNCAIAVEGPYLRDDHWVLECKKCEYSMRHIMSEEQCIKSHNGYVSSKRDPECPWNEEYRCTYVGTDKCTVQCAHRRGVAKAPMDLLDLEFAAAMCDNFQRGIQGDRVANGWKDMEWSKELHDEYISSILRHLRAYRAGTGSDDHLAAIACNANIIWHHERKDV